MPAGARHPGNDYHAVADGETVDVWTPFTYASDDQNRGSHYMEAIARLKAGFSVAQARQDMEVQLAQLASEHESAKGWHPLVVPLYQELVGPTRRLLLVLLGAVGLVLLIACANAANLLMARATSRQREIAVRAALGAGRWRLVRQMLAESLLISLVGGGLGAGIAVGGVQALTSLLPADFPRASDIHVNAGIFAFTLLVALATGVLFGLAPALQAARTDLQQALREGGRAATSGAHHLWLRNALVVGEVSLACVLLIGAGLMLRSFANLLHTDPGFRPEHVLTAGLSLPSAQYKKISNVIQFYDQLDARLKTIPGVRAAGSGSDLPWTGWDENLGGFGIEGQDRSTDNKHHTRYHVASPDYFQALGIPLVPAASSRLTILAKRPIVIIINRAMARAYWGKDDAVGGRITFADAPKEKDWMTVVGVVGDVKDHPNSSAASPGLWWPLLQEPFGFPQMSIAVSAVADPGQLAGQVRETVRALDPNLAVSDVKLMDRGGREIVLHAALRAVSGGALRSARRQPGGHRDLRRDLVFGEPADARIRPAHGFGRKTRRRGAAGDGTGHPAGAGRNRHRHRGGVGAGPRAMEPALPGERHRSADVRRRGRRGYRDRRSSLLHSRAARHRHRPHDRAAIRVIPSTASRGPKPGSGAELASRNSWLLAYCVTGV